MIRGRRRALGLVAAAAAVLLLSPPAQAADPTTEVAWLSTGDSYSSGEGISGSGVGSDYCAQSTLAYGPRALKLLIEQRGYRPGKDQVAFSACTGLLTGDFYNEQRDVKGVGSGDGSLWKWTQEQTTTGATFDVVTFSFGGNDLDFPTLIRDCSDLQIPPGSWREATSVAFRDGCHVTDAELSSRIDNLFAGNPMLPQAWHYGEKDRALTLASFYETVANQRLKPGGVLVVVGYPRLISRSQDWPAWRGDMCARVFKEDADKLGRATEELDGRMRAATEEARGRLTGDREIRYVSRLDQFDADGGHSLCSRTGSEWLNGVSVGSSSGLRFEHSFHPNERGHQVTAELVAAQVEQALKPPPPKPAPSTAPLGSAPPTTGPPAIRDTAPHYEIGSTFSDVCVNAWPTAPSYTSTSIVLTMSCQRTPKQFLFVQVTYPDPDLPITPSTGSVAVHGRVVDVSRSAYGYSQLIVTADQIKIGR